MRGDWCRGVVFGWGWGGEVVAEGVGETGGGGGAFGWVGCGCVKLAVGGVGCEGGVCLGRGDAEGLLGLLVSIMYGGGSDLLGS